MKPTASRPDFQNNKPKHMQNILLRNIIDQSCEDLRALALDGEVVFPTRVGMVRTNPQP